MIVITASGAWPASIATAISFTAHSSRSSARFIRGSANQLRTVPSERRTARAISL